MTCLELICEQINFEREFAQLARIFLANGAWVNGYCSTNIVIGRNILTRTLPIINAIKNRNVTLISLLAYHGSRLDGCMKHALNLNQSFHSTYIIEFFLDGEFIDIEDSIDINGNTPLIYACSHSRILEIEMLLKRGANTNKLVRRSARPMTLLSYIASSPGTEDIMRLLIKYNAQLDPFLMLPPLYYAVAHHRVYNVKFLIEAGADVNAYLPQDSVERRERRRKYYSCKSILMVAIDNLLRLKTPDTKEIVTDLIIDGYADTTDIDDWRKESWILHWDEDTDDLWDYILEKKRLRNSFPLFK